VGSVMGADLRSRGGVPEVLLGDWWRRPRLQERLACPLARPSRALGLLAWTHSEPHVSGPASTRLQGQLCPWTAGCTGRSHVRCMDIC
jgi:hypothetical protein